MTLRILKVNIEWKISTEIFILYFYEDTIKEKKEKEVFICVSVRRIHILQRIVPITKG